MEEQKVVFNDAMIGRADELDNAAYQYFMTLLGLDDKEAGSQQKDEWTPFRCFYEYFSDSLS